MAMLYSRSLIPSVNYRKPLFFYSFCVVSLADTCMLQNIVGIIFVYLRCSVLYRLKYICNYRILLIFHFQRSDCLICSHFIFSYDCGNIITVEFDFICKQKSVRHILMTRVCRPWMSCCREVVFILSQIKTGNNLYNTFNFFSLCGIN